MSKSSEAVKRWRKNCKDKIIQSMGGGCNICGYNKCSSALALHHIDPSQKDISFGKIRANPKNWNLITKELKKCILVCHNCHSEIHADITQIPKEFNKFKELSIDKLYIDSENEKDSDCPVCGNKKFKHLITCSRKCAAKRSCIVDWGNIDLGKELLTKTYQKIAEELGCSDGAVHKRARKLGLK